MKIDDALVADVRYATKSESFVFSADNLIQLYIKNSAVGGGTFIQNPSLVITN